MFSNWYGLNYANIHKNPKEILTLEPLIRSHGQCTNYSYLEISCFTVDSEGESMQTPYGQYSMCLSQA